MATHKGYRPVSAKIMQVLVLNLTPRACLIKVGKFVLITSYLALPRTSEPYHITIWLLVEYQTTEECAEAILICD